MVGFLTGRLLNGELKHVAAQSNCLWGHATLRHMPSEVYLTAMTGRIMADVPALQAQHLANSVWALATCSYHHPVRAFAGRMH